MQRKILKEVKNKFNTPILLIIVGVFLMLTASSHWYLKYQSLRLDQSLLSQHISQDVDDNKIPSHINIGWKVDTDIEQHLYKENKWTISEDQASYLSNSALPGENGNIIIYGHNKNEIMGNIRLIKGNELITITTNDGTKYDYIVETIAEVEPNDTQYLKPTEKEVLTLYTCSGFMDSKRFIIQATPFVDNN